MESLWNQRNLNCIWNGHFHNSFHLGLSYCPRTRSRSELNWTDFGGRCGDRFVFKIVHFMSCTRQSWTMGHSSYVFFFKCDVKWFFFLFFWFRKEISMTARKDCFRRWYRTCWKWPKGRLLRFYTFVPRFRAACTKYTFLFLFSSTASVHSLLWCHRTETFIICPSIRLRRSPRSFWRIIPGCSWRRIRASSTLTTLYSASRRPMFYFIWEKRKYGCKCRVCFLFGAFLLKTVFMNRSPQPSELSGSSEATCKPSHPTAKVSFWKFLHLRIHYFLHESHFLLLYTDWGLWGLDKATLCAFRGFSYGQKALKSAGIWVLGLGTTTHPGIRLP